MSKIVYNVTTKISNQKHDEWVSYMVEKHIPEVMVAGKFESFTMKRLIGDDSDDGITYAIGFTAWSMADLHKYQVNHAPALQEDHKKRFEGHYASFRTLMEIIAEG